MILFPVLPAPGQLFLVIVMGGMCAGAMAISASYLPSLLAFVLATSLPMALLFFVHRSTTDGLLATMIVVFAAALSLAGRHFSNMFAEALRLRFELGKANLRLTEANHRLQVEMAERRATEGALHQAQKLEAMGHLMGGIAHDFNNLLTVVVGNATLLRDRAADEPARRRAAAILSIADRGERLIRQLLAFSRRRTLRPEAVALQGRTSEIAELLAGSPREDIAVTIDLPADLWPVTVDPGEFEMALLNIAVNARDAMRKGGAFRLTARNTRSGGETAMNGLVGEFVAITLTDTGTGMPAEVMAQAFEPYFTTKPEGLGSGLGLSQVYGFANQSGGSAALASAPGEGTAITMFPPRASAGPAMADDMAAQPAFAPGSARILLVENDQTVAEATQDLLHNMGFDTRLAGDGMAALALVESDPKLALVLSDVVMPGGVSGLDLARTLRDRRPEMPVILAAGYSSRASEVVAEGFALVEKPYRRDVLGASLRSALEGRVPRFRDACRRLLTIQPRPMVELNRGTGLDHLPPVKRRDAPGSGHPFRDRTYCTGISRTLTNGSWPSPTLLWKRGNIVENDIFWVESGRPIWCILATSPNRRDPRVEEGYFPASREAETVCLTLPNGTVLSDGPGSRLPETQSRRWESRKARAGEIAEKSQGSVSWGSDAGSARRRPPHHRRDRPTRNRSNQGPPRPAGLLSRDGESRKRTHGSHQWRPRSRASGWTPSREQFVRLSRAEIVGREVLLPVRWAVRPPPDRHGGTPVVDAVHSPSVDGHPTGRPLDRVAALQRDAVSGRIYNYNARFDAIAILLSRRLSRRLGRLARAILDWGLQERRIQRTRAGGSPLPERSHDNRMKPWLTLPPSRLAFRATLVP
jgi:signal transduction histidine kinase/CheY-like chemotaxis protein